MFISEWHHMPPPDIHHHTATHTWASPILGSNPIFLNIGPPMHFHWTSSICLTIQPSPSSTHPSIFYQHICTHLSMVIHPSSAHTSFICPSSFYHLSVWPSTHHPSTHNPSICPSTIHHQSIHQFLIHISTYSLSIHQYIKHPKCIYHPSTHNPSISPLTIHHLLPTTHPSPHHESTNHRSSIYPTSIYPS